ncbi:hypothetical protein D3C75_831260 [compost metagenome]
MREGEFRCKLAILLTPGVRCSEPGGDGFEGPVHQLIAVHNSDSVFFTVAVRVLLSEGLGHGEQFIQIGRSLKSELIRPILAVDDTLTGQRPADIQGVQLAIHFGIVEDFRFQLVEVRKLR